MCYQTLISLYLSFVFVEISTAWRKNYTIIWEQCPWTQHSGSFIKTCQPYPWPMSSLIWTPITRYLISPVASIISSLFLLDNQFLPLLRIFLSPWKFLSGVGFSRLRHINTMPHYNSSQIHVLLSCLFLFSP